MWNHPKAWSFLAGNSLSLLLGHVDTSNYCGHVGNQFFDIVFFQHQNKTKTMNFTKHGTETFLLKTLSHKMEEDRFSNQKEVFWCFDTFVNQGCVNKIKMYLNLHLGSMLFPKFLRFWKLMHIKNSFFNATAKLKCCELKYFGQTRNQNAAKCSI